MDEKNTILQEIRDLMLQGEKFKAVKKHHLTFGTSLKESVEAVEKLAKTEVKQTPLDVASATKSSGLGCLLLFIFPLTALVMALI